MSPIMGPRNREDAKNSKRANRKESTGFQRHQVRTGQAFPGNFGLCSFTTHFICVTGPISSDLRFLRVLAAEFLCWACYRNPPEVPSLYLQGTSIRTLAYLRLKFLTI